MERVTRLPASRFCASLMTSLLCVGLAACGGGGGGGGSGEGGNGANQAASTVATTAPPATSPAAPTAAPPAAPTAAPPIQPPLPSKASITSRYAGNNLTLPSGLVKMGSHLWVSDHGLGFCRLDASKAGSAAPFEINQATCNPSATSPGQPAFDAASGFVYVPDNSSRSQGVWRLTFDTATETVGSPLLMAGGAGLAGKKAQAVALGPDKNLYVVFGISPSIVRVTTPAGATQTVQTLGQVADKRGPPSIAILGDDLYLAEAAGVTKVPGISACNASACTAQAMPITEINVPAPTFVASDQANSELYIGDLGNVYRYRVSTALCASGGIEDVLKSGVSGGFQNISALGVDPNGDLFVGDDTSAGVLILSGGVFRIAPASTALAETAGTCGNPPAPPALPTSLGQAITQGTLLGGNNLTLPSGLAKMGSHLWVSDHGLGFCRLDASKAGSAAPFEINQTTCSPAATSPGQPAFDAVNNFVYVPDNSSKSQGVWRLSFDPVAQTVGSQLLMAGSGSVLAGKKAQAVALGPDGKLYVAFGTSPSIVRVTSPAGPNQTVETVGQVTDARGGPPSIAFAGGDLYLAEAAGVTKVAAIAACNGSCAAADAKLGLTAPVFITSDGVDKLYVAELTGVARFTVSTKKLETYATAGTVPTSGSARVPFNNVSALGLDGAKLYVGDDPSAGNVILAGRVWEVLPPPP